MAKGHSKGEVQLVATHQHKNVRKHFPEPKETQYGHMRGQRQGVRSTQRVQPVQGKCNEEKIKKKQDISIHVYELDEDNQLTNAIYSNQTGDFPYISSRGNRSIMVIHHVDSNSLWVEPLKTQKEGALIAAQTIILEKMR